VKKRQNRKNRNMVDRFQEDEIDDEIVKTYMFAVKLTVFINRKLQERTPIIISSKKIVKHFSHFRIILEYLNKYFEMERDGTWYIIKRRKKMIRKKRITLTQKEQALLEELVS